MFKKNKKTAFTLVELLVVIAIIGILSTLAVISLQNARAKARDAKRVADIRQIQTALELYYNSEGEYPSNLQVGSPIQSPGGTIYMPKFPQAPNITEGSCSNGGYSYEQKNNGSSYEISFCLSSKIGDLEAGYNLASPGGITSPPPPFVCGTNFTDSRDGREYSTIEIEGQFGTQCWMKENLAYLPGVNPPSDGSEINPKYYVYGYNGTSTDAAKAHEIDEVNIYNTYGVLYNYPAAMNFEEYEEGKKHQGICPDGWHLPSGNVNFPNDDWSILASNLGGRSAAGGKMKEAGTAHWNSPNEGADNSSGFTALPGGIRYVYGSFDNLSERANFWSASPGVDSFDWFHPLYHDLPRLGSGRCPRSSGLSVRCLLSNP